MKTSTETEITPEAMREQLLAMGFSLECSVPLGAVDEKQWPHIAYNVRLLYKGKEVIATPYKLGVGHVEPKKAHAIMLRGWGPDRLTVDEESLLLTWQSKPYANFQNKELQAQIAAKLAKAQKVFPTLETVLHSLCSDGEAFFNAQRFEEWASYFGYDADSRAAEQIFNACDAIGRKLARGIPADVLVQVRELTSSL
jgi:hypothetical protein